jgi:integrase/recombinase XerD
VEQNYKPRSTARFLSGVRGFYRYLLREKLIAVDPTLRIDMPQLGRPLPKSLSEADVEALLKAPDLSEAIGQRDRAMLEVLYACGLRVTELISLTLEQVNLRQGVLRVMGKGSKERLVPMGEEAIVWVERYMRDGRGELLGGRPSDVLFPSQRGEQMTRQTFWHRIKHQAKVAGSASRCRRTHCVTLSPRTCSTTAPTCGWCRCCWGTAICRPPRSIPMLPGRGCRTARQAPP